MEDGLRGTLRYLDHPGTNGTCRRWPPEVELGGDGTEVAIYFPPVSAEHMVCGEWKSPEQSG